MAMMRNTIGIGAASMVVLLLAGCGGGGRPATASTPPPTTPTAPPDPTPSPPGFATTPAPGLYDTPEYFATRGAVSMNALAAYEQGATGTGVTIGVIDSGIDLQSPEFENRISAASRDFGGTGRTIDDISGHGTAVAFTAAGRNNDVGTHGVAFDATLLVLRADSEGTCGGDDGCTFGERAIASSLDLAVAQGARVVNISLGGADVPGSTFLSAVQRATAAGVIIVIAAGNEGVDDPATAVNPEPFATAAASRGGNLVVISGSVGTDDQISDFSNRAGSYASQYLTALGESVRAPNHEGDPYLWSGTSFSAPQISGAIALLAQAFPNLTGAQLVQILYNSARDAGAAGIDAIYGRGVLDLTAAFDPQGSLTVAGTAVPVSATSNASLSAPMGDAAGASAGAIILDGFSRAYRMEMAHTLSRQAPSLRLTNGLRDETRRMAARFAGATVAVTIRPGMDATLIERMTLRSDDAARAQALAASVAGRLGKRTQFALAASETGATLVARLRGRADAAFLVAADPLSQTGFTSDVAGAAALRRAFGPWNVSLSAETGAVPDRDARTGRAPDAGRDRYHRLTIGLDRDIGPLALSLAASRLSESGTLLGARFSEALGAARGDSWFVDAGARLALGGGWTLVGTTRQGWTQARLADGTRDAGTLRTTGHAIDVTRAGLFHRHDLAGLRIAQPLRVARGGFDLDLPSAYAYGTASVTGWTTQRLNLAPRGREIDAELSYARPLGTGWVAGNLFYRRDPGNIAALPDDMGAAVRFSAAF